MKWRTAIVSLDVDVGSAFQQCSCRGLIPYVEDHGFVQYALTLKISDIGIRTMIQEPVKESRQAVIQRNVQGWFAIFVGRIDPRQILRKRFSYRVIYLALLLRQECIAASGKEDGQRYDAEDFPMPPLNCAKD